MQKDDGERRRAINDRRIQIDGIEIREFEIMSDSGSETQIVKKRVMG